MIVETSLALGVLTLALALLLVHGWRRSAERRSRPKALVHAELVYMEQLFRIRDPIPLVARVDRAYRLPGGSLVLVELKSRKRNRPYLSDVIQLSAQRLAIEMQTGEVVEPYGFVSVPPRSSLGSFSSHRVGLLSTADLVRLYARRAEVLALRVVPDYAASKITCDGCALRSKCDRFGGRA